MATTWAVGVTTAPRGHDYLPATLSSLEAAGWPDVRVFNDDGKGPDHKGPWKNLLAAMSSLECQGTDFVAVFQDDIEVTEGLRDWLEQGNLPVTDGIVSLYCRWKIDSGGCGWRQYDMENLTCKKGHTHRDPKLLGKDFRVCAEPGCKMPLRDPWFECSGALAYCMRRGVARDMLSSLPKVAGLTQSDYKVAQWCYEQGRPLHYHEPSLVQHVGLCSAAHGNPKCQMPMTFDRVAKRFARNTTEIDGECLDERYSGIKMQPLVYQKQN